MNFMDRLFNLKNKVIVVTGANGQLGNVICRAFKGTGSKVIGIDLNINNNRVDDVEYFTANITKKDEISGVFEKIMTGYGAIDVLINNAGVSTFEPFEVRPEEKIDWVMDVNLKGSFFCIQSYVNVFDKFKLKSGSIINIASIYGVISPDFRIYTDCDRKNSEIYGATKAGVIQLTKYFAVHLADRNIRVNAISPGGVFNPDNPQGEDFVRNYSFRCPMKRMANDEEIVGALIYLAGDAASYTSGVNIAIDGGMSCW